MAQQISLADAIKKIKEEVGPDGVLYDLGSGPTPEDGFVGIDSNVVADNVLNFDLYCEWDFSPDGSVDVLHASHFVEHVPDWNKFFTNAYRVLKPGGYFIITSPYYTSVRAWQDPDHKQPISEARFMYLNRKWREVNQIDHYNADVDFRFYEVSGSPFVFYSWHPDFEHVPEARREYAKEHFVNAIQDIAVILVRK